MRPYRTYDAPCIRWGIRRHPAAAGYIKGGGVPMEDRTFAEAQLLSAQLLYGRITRRAFLRRAAAIGLSASMITMILDACGGSSSPAPTATSSAPQPTATLLPTALPVNAGQPTATAGSASASSVAPAGTRAAGSAVAPTVAATTASGTTAASGTPVKGGTLTVGDANEPTGLDPGGLSGVDA